MTTTTRSVKFDREWMERREMGVNTNAEIISKLRKAGIPVIGELVIRGVGCGTLTMVMDAEKDTQFIWCHVPEFDGELPEIPEAGTPARPAIELHPFTEDDESDLI